MPAMDQTNDSKVVPKLLKEDTSSHNLCASELAEKVHSIVLDSNVDSSNVRSPRCSLEDEDLSPQVASQILWETGSFDSKIPNGFYSIIPSKILKARFDSIPTPEELCAMGPEAARADAILVDSEKDIKLAKLKEFTVAAVKGLSSNPAVVIRKIAEVVSDFYGGPLSEASAAKLFLDESPSAADSFGFQLLGKIKNGLCRPRAMLFKVLADAAGLRSKLVVGLQVYDRVILQPDPDKHMSLLVGLNSTELLVDVMRSTGQLIPFSTRGLMLCHFPGGVESDSADNDSCDSPLEPSSPMFGLSDKYCNESPELEDRSVKFIYPMKGENLFTLSGPTSPDIKQRRTAYIDRTLSVSRSEPDIANFFLHRNRRKAIGDLRSANSSPEQLTEPMFIQRRHKLDGVRSFPSSPEHPLLRARGRSTLGSQRQSSRDDADPASASSSDHSPQYRVIARRDSMNPRCSISSLHSGGEDGRAVRALNEQVKRESRHVSKQEHGSADKATPNDQKDEDIQTSTSKNVPNSRFGNQRSTSTERKVFSDTYKKICLSSQKGVLLPLHVGEIERNQSGKQTSVPLEAVHSTVLSVCKPSLPFTEWNIDSSELRIGARVGIGSFGEVYRGVWRGTDVAIKILLEQDLTMENMEDFCNEIAVLSRLRHPNVILFLGACTTPPHLSMVTEYMHMGSLYHLIHTSDQGKKLSWRRRLKMLLDICRGMMCIQRMKIVHRDLKSANCLVDKHSKVKICDFGLSRIMVNSPIKDFKAAGTPEWMAPELLRNEPFAEKCDVFSFGVIMWELCTLRRPWDGVKPMQVVYAVAHEGARLDIPEGLIGKLISDCWAEDPSARPCCEEIFTRLHECEVSVN